MDFARKQLEKYGWTDGKGLGKHEDGISQAIRPKLKRSVTGVGHDPAAEFNEHWWSKLYDKAAKNVEVQNSTEIKTNDSDNFSITNNSYLISKKSKNNSKNEQYQDYFVKKAVLSGESRTENVEMESESETEDEQIKNNGVLTDEELFKACGGRTAHKGARHGLKATGKLARIQQQELLLLSLPRYEGYSHAKNRKKSPENVIEQITLTSETIPERKKKKKKKRCISTSLQECHAIPFVEKNNGDVCDKNNEVVQNEEKISKKKNRFRNENDVSQKYQAMPVVEEKNVGINVDTEIISNNGNNGLVGNVTKPEKKKRKAQIVCEQESEEVQNIVKKKKKKV